ncbi:MAG: NrfD/PsrC family molybdoenzyme membrane anchor subunit [Planctomycetaceae bacterium]
MDVAPFVFPNDVHPSWSIMIVLYPYVTGLVAGSFVVSALYHVFQQDALRPVAKLALLTSLCFCGLATLPLLLHLHHPERSFLIFVTPNPTSAIAGFGFIYSTYMLVLVFEVWLVFRPVIVQRSQTRTGVVGILYRTLALGARNITDNGRAVDAVMIRGLALVGIPIACVLHGYVGFLFGAVKANPWWSTALMPVIFLISAVVSGIALLVLLYLFLCWRRHVAPQPTCVRSLSRYLWVFLLGALSLEGLELLQMAYESAEEWEVLSQLLTDHLAVSYGLLQIIVGSICPLLLLPIAIQPRLNTRLMCHISALASLLVLVQVFSMRWNVVVGGQLFSKSFRGFVDYTMTWGGREGVVAASVVVVLPLLVLWGASRMLPVWSDQES